MALRPEKCSDQPKSQCLDSAQLSLIVRPSVSQPTSISNFQSVPFRITQFYDTIEPRYSGLEKYVRYKEVSLVVSIVSSFCLVLQKSVLCVAIIYIYKKCSLKRGFVVPGFFSIYFTSTRGKIPFVIPRTSLN